MNKVHTLDPDAVAEQISASIDRALTFYESAISAVGSASLKQLYLRTMHDVIFKALTYYIKVRVVELPTTRKKRFILVYGSTNNRTITTGTGPFESAAKARAWFFDGGR